LHKNNLLLLRAAAGSRAMEQRALAAEAHAAGLGAALERIGYALPQLQRQARDAAGAVEAYSAAAADSALQLEVLQGKFDKGVQENKTCVAKIEELNDELFLNCEALAQLQYESSEKDLEIGRLTKDIELSLAERKVLETAAELAKIEHEDERKRAAEAAAAASTPKRKAGTPGARVQSDREGEGGGEGEGGAVAGSPGARAERHATVTSLQAEVKTQAAALKDLRGKVKLLESKARHGRSKLEVAEVAAEALQLNALQVKQALDKANARILAMSKQLSGVETELQHLKDSSLLERGHLLRESKSLRGELLSERADVAHLKELVALNKEAVHRTMTELKGAAPRGVLSQLAAALDLPGDWDGGGAAAEGSPPSPSPLKGPPSPPQRGPAASAGGGSGFVPLDPSVAISFTGALPSAAYGGGAGADRAGYGTPVASNVNSNINSMYSNNSNAAEGSSRAGGDRKASPTPLRRLWNSVSVPQGGGGGGGALPYSEDDAGDADTVATAMTVSLDSRDVRQPGPGPAAAAAAAAPVTAAPPSIGGAGSNSVSFNFGGSDTASPGKQEPTDTPPRPPPSRAGRAGGGKEKFNGLSLVVEDRLLRSIFAKYTSDLKTLMRASRFLRFTKEYGICMQAQEGGAGLEVIYGGHENLKLSSGDIDVIFAVALKKTAEGVSKSSTLQAQQGQGQGQGHAALRKAWGASRSARTGGEASMLSYPQFLEALYMCGERMYTAVIEKETGTVIDCLPSSQRAAASRSAFEVMVVKNLVPTAEQHGIMPWPLLYLDQTVSLLHFDAGVQETLVRYARPLTMWFGRAASHGSGGRGVALGDGQGEEGVFVGVTYKDVSSACHGAQLVPQLVQETELYRIYEEVLQWSVSDIRILADTLPQELQRLSHVWSEVNARQLGRTPALSKLLGFIGFVYVVATVATQVGLGYRVHS
jgi:hypothetical protein